MLRVAALLIVVIAALAAPPRAFADDSPVDRAQALLDELVPHVEKAVGATFVEAPTLHVLPADQALRAFALDLQNEVDRRYARASEAQRRTVLLATARASVRSSLARYSFAKGGIVIVKETFDSQRESLGYAADEAEDLLRAVLAHEAVHALDDQRTDLATLYKDAPDAEALRARAMIVEGRAVAFGRRAAEAAGVSERARALLPGGDTPATQQAWLLRLTYELGAAFVEDVLDRGGHDLCHQALVDPPPTTHVICQPTRWPDDTVDPRPAETLAAAGFDEGVNGVSELELRARYAFIHGRTKSDAVFSGYRGGAQVLHEGANAAVLAFAAAVDARRYQDIAGKEAPTQAHGDMVVRAYGDNAEALLKRLAAALTSADSD